MVKTKRNWNRKPFDERVSFARTVIDNQKATPAPVSPADPNLTALDTELAAIEAVVTDIKDKELQLKALRDNARAKWDAFAEKLGLNASYVESVSQGDSAKIIGIGYELVGEPGAVGPLTQVAALVATMGDDEGTLDLNWDPVTGATGYEVQVTLDPTTSTTWKTVSTVARSKVMLTGLQSGKRHWVRVRAIGRNSPGAWSDEASKMVP